MKLKLRLLVSVMFLSSLFHKKGPRYLRESLPYNTELNLGISKFWFLKFWFKGLTQLRLATAFPLNSKAEETHGCLVNRPDISPPFFSSSPFWFLGGFFIVDFFAHLIDGSSMGTYHDLSCHHDCNAKLKEFQWSMGPWCEIRLVKIDELGETEVA